MKTLIFMVLSLLPLTGAAQEHTVCPEEQSPAEVIDPDGIDFMPVEYDGFWFEVPRGSIVTEENSKVAKYPDGTFGVSATTIRERGSNKKRAMNICKGIAGDMRLKNPKVQEFKTNGLKGALATGDLEGQTVTIAVVPVNDKELTVVTIATAARTGWTSHLLSSLKKK